MKKKPLVARGRTTTVRLHKRMGTPTVTLTPRWWAWFLKSEHAPRGEFPAVMVAEFQHQEAGWFRPGWVYFGLTLPGDREPRGCRVEYGWGARHEFGQVATAFRAVTVW